MWAWIAADREREFGGAAGVLLFVQVIVGPIVVLGASVAAFWQPWWLLIVLVPALAALPWAAARAGLAGLVLLLTYSMAVLAPLIAVHLASIVSFRLIEAVVELVTGGDPAGVWRPTVRPVRSAARHAPASPPPSPPHEPDDAA
jgi:hypothetical protein